MKNLPDGLVRIIIIGCAIHFIGALAAAGAMLTSVQQ